VRGKLRRATVILFREQIITRKLTEHFLQCRHFCHKIRVTVLGRMQRSRPGICDSTPSTSALDCIAVGQHPCLHDRFGVARRKMLTDRPTDFSRPLRPFELIAYRSSSCSHPCVRAVPGWFEYLRRAEVGVWQSCVSKNAQSRAAAHFMQEVLDHVSTFLPVISFPLSLGVINVIQWVTRMQAKIHDRIAEGISDACGIYL